MPIVSGHLFAETAYSYNGKGLTYQDYDCVHFMNFVRNTCGLNSLQQGTNWVWRGRGLVWKGTIQEAYAKYNGVLPQGLLLFHVVPDDSPDADPTHHGYGDGIGDVNHVGIYTNIGLGVMQSGGYDGTGVHDSRLRSYFNLAAECTGIDYSGAIEPYLTDPVKYRSFWCSPDIYDIGQSYREQNANCIKSKLHNDLAWTLESVCGVLGNMQYESGLNPAYINPTYRNQLPSETDLSYLPNFVMMFYMQSYYGTPANEFGLGLLQWTNTTVTNYLEQSYIVARAIKDHYSDSNSTRQLWYEGWFQAKRLNTEKQQDSQIRRFNPCEVNGVWYSYESYAGSYSSPADCAEAWAIGYLNTNSGIAERRQYASDWWTYFNTVNPPYVPEPAPEPYTKPEFPWYIMIDKKKKGVRRACQGM